MSKLELRDYQKADLEFALSRDRSCNFSECGTGKSPTFSRYIYMRYLMNGAKTVFIMPSGIMKKNQEDICEWTPFTEDEVVIVRGTPKQRLSIYENSNIKVFIISADTFSNEWKLMLEKQPDINSIVIDENHLLYSTHTSKRTQQLYLVSRKIQYFYACTGTPLNGRFSSVYPLCAICEPRFYFNYQTFLNYHGVYDNFGRIVAWGRPEKLKKVLQYLGPRHTFEECYSNSKGYQLFVEKADIDENLKENYQQLEEEALLELEDQYLECDNPAVKAMRARVLLSCPEMLNLENKPKFNGKDKVLKVHLENAKEEKSRILIFSCFQAEQIRVKNICEEMGLKVEIINGSVSSKKRGEIDTAFRNHDLDVVIGSPQTCSVGFNWEFAKEVIFLSMDYQDSSFEQGIKRLDRGTRKTAIPVYLISYKTKVEKRIIDIVKRKMKEKVEVFGL